MSELTAHKYRDLKLKHPTGAKAISDETPTVSPPNGGFLMPATIPVDPVVAAYYSRIDIGEVPGFFRAKPEEPVHPLKRLRDYTAKGESIDNGLAPDAPVSLAYLCRGLECGF
jgi:hypothetical protein